jgi:hypothetical protein
MGVVFLLLAIAPPCRCIGQRRLGVISTRAARLPHLMFNLVTNKVKHKWQQKSIDVLTD